MSPYLASEICLTFEKRISFSLSLSTSAILREEVMYVHTDSDLLAMEKAARGKTDIVLGYVSSLGTQGIKRRECGYTEAGEIKRRWLWGQC